MRIQDGKAVKRTVCELPAVLVCVMLLLGNLIIHMLQWESRYAYTNVYMLVTFTALVFLCVKYFKRQSLVAWLLLLFFVWQLITRLIVGDFNLTIRKDIFCIAEMYVVFQLSSVMNERQKKISFDLYSLISLCILALWALCALAVVLTDIKEIPLFDQTIYIEENFWATGKERQPIFFLINRNISAAWFMIGLWMVVVQWIRHPNSFLRLILAGFGLLMYLVISMQHCRSVNVANAISFGMLLILLLKDRVTEPRRYLKLAGILLAALLTTLVIYKSYAACNRVIEKITWFQSEPYVYVEPENLTQNNTAAQTDEQTGSTTEVTALVDDRSFFKDLLTMSNRIALWADTLETMWKNPTFFLLGQRDADYGRNLQEFSSMKKWQAHAHNTLVQALAIYGVPGFLLMLGIVVLLIVKSIRLYFSNAELTKKLMAIFVLCLLTDGIMEPLFSYHLEFSSAACMFFAGLVFSASDRKAM